MLPIQTDVDRSMDEVPINQQLAICQQMLKIWYINNVSFFCKVVKKLGAFIVYSLSFNLANLNWPQEQSNFIRYLWDDSTFCYLTFFELMRDISPVEGFLIPSPNLDLILRGFIVEFMGEKAHTKKGHFDIV